MSHKKVKTKLADTVVIDLDSDSDDTNAGGRAVKRQRSDCCKASEPLNVRSVETGVPVSRIFWKAGDFEKSSRAPTFIPVQDDLEHARIHPRFLHSNATSHKWAFGAIAELLDNAVDEIGNGATFINIDRVYNDKDNTPALLFQDDGGGMDPKGMRKCMSLGYSSKFSTKAIGQYGNGFKTSTMRLGADVIVFSRAVQSSRAATQSIGLLSYTFLRKTRQDDVIVPMIDFYCSDQLTEPIIYSSKEDWYSNLKTILEWSPFASKDDLLRQFADIGSHGTKIIIFNLWMNDEGVYELNFDDDDEDIKLRDEAYNGTSLKTNKRTLELQSHLSHRLRYSLRAYLSILYLKKFTNFKIILRGQPVMYHMIVNDLKHSKVVIYRPYTGDESKELKVETTIGFIKEAPALGVCGFNVYHRNRLIRPYWNITSYVSAKGLGVVGVLEANFMKPAHDKQDFERSILFVKLESRLKQMVVDYWKSHSHFVGHQPSVTRKSNIRNQSIEQIQIDDSVPDISMDKMHEDNIKLYMRCEEYVQKEGELNKTIEELENELREIRDKCARISSHMDDQKKQTIYARKT